jgi:hypothetical protein
VLLWKLVLYWKLFFSVPLFSFKFSFLYHKAQTCTKMHTHAHTHTHTHTRAYAHAQYCSHYFGLCKIQIVQDLLEQNDCINQEASAVVLVLECVCFQNIFWWNTLLKGGFERIYQDYVVFHFICKANCFQTSLYIPEMKQSNMYINANAQHLYSYF